MKETFHPSGIDKVQVISRDFEVTDTLQFAVIPYSKKQGKADFPEIPKRKDHFENDCDYAEYLIQKKEQKEEEKKYEQIPIFSLKGQPFYASKIYHNAPSEMGNLSINIDVRGAQIIFNPSKYLDKYSGELATPQETYNLITDIQKYLTEIGFKSNLSNFKLSRIDIAKDRVMSDKVFTYQEVFNLFSAKRETRKTLYPDGLTIGNASRQDCFYDKGLVIKPKDGSTNLMRGEFRLMKHKSIKDTLNISHFGQMKEISTKELSYIHSNHIQKDIYQAGDLNQQSFDFTNDVTLLKSYRQQGRGGWKKLVMMKGVDYFLKIRGIDVFRQILDASGYDKSAISKITKEVKEMERLLSFLPNAPKLSVKYGEVYEKFVA